MADQDQAVDTDYSGRPYRVPTTEEVLASPLPSYCPYDRAAELPDGRTAVASAGRYYLVKDGGWPDWDRPVYLPGLSRGPPRDGDLIVRLEDYDAEEDRSFRSP